MAIFTVAFTSGDDLNIEIEHIEDPREFAAQLDREGHIAGTKIGFVPSGGKPAPKAYGQIVVMRSHVKTIRLHD